MNLPLTGGRFLKQRPVPQGRLDLDWPLGRVLVEAACCYRYRNVAGAALIQRRKGCPPEVIRIAKRAQDRLHRKFWRMIKRNKPSQVTAVAVARELAGFIWSIGQLCPATVP